MLGAGDPPYAKASAGRWN